MRRRLSPILAKISHETLVDTNWTGYLTVAWVDPLRDFCWVSRYGWLARFMRNWHEGWLAGGLFSCPYSNR